MTTSSPWSSYTGFGAELFGYLCYTILSISWLNETFSYATIDAKSGNLYMHYVSSDATSFGIATLKQMLALTKLHFICQSRYSESIILLRVVLMDGSYESIYPIEISLLAKVVGILVTLGIFLPFGQASRQIEVVSILRSFKRLLLSSRDWG